MTNDNRYLSLRGQFPVFNQSVVIVGANGMQVGLALLKAFLLRLQSNQKVFCGIEVLGVAVIRTRKHFQPTGNTYLLDNSQLREFRLVVAALSFALFDGRPLLFDTRS